MNVLVTGGAGYIGSHAVLALLAAGYRPIVVDDLSTGRRAAVPAEVPLFVQTIGDREALSPIFDRHRIDAVLHFAGSIIVGESMAKPLEYYRNNVANSLAVIECAVEFKVPTFVFSSSAGVYGVPARLPIQEDAPTVPISPYGMSKLMVEQMLRDAAQAHGLNAVMLRYFNVAGADSAGRAGQAPPRATHLINVACEAAVGRRDHVPVFGDDYDTPDGTCVRDYVHVSDLADAHVGALTHLARVGGVLTFNCGYGRGASVREVLAAVERVAGKKLDIRVGPRRPGDPPTLVADTTLIKRTLGWTPSFDALDTIVASALEWERRRASEGASPRGESE